MKYETVTLDEKKIAGISARTNNTSPDMASVIGGLWTKFYGEGIYDSIPGKKSGKALGIYTDYEKDEAGDYTIMTACETDAGAQELKGIVYRTIPAGRYAKFIIKGDLHKAVMEFWGELWKMDLPRSFICDFEEYQNADVENAEIHVYIGLKEERQ